MSWEQIPIKRLQHATFHLQVIKKQVMSRMTMQLRDNKPAQPGVSHVPAVLVSPCRLVYSETAPFAMSARWEMVHLSKCHLPHSS